MVRGFHESRVLLSLVGTSGNPMSPDGSDMQRVGGQSGQPAFHTLLTTEKSAQASLLLFCSYALSTCIALKWSSATMLLLFSARGADAGAPGEQSVCSGSAKAVRDKGALLISGGLLVVCAPKVLLRWTPLCDMASPQRFSEE